MANFSDSKINEVWEKAKIIDNYDSAKYRQDIAGAWIQRDKYGLQEDFGWQIDHQFPESLGGGNEIENLQPLQWKNNETKGNNFPEFFTSVSSELNKYIELKKSWNYNSNFIEKLKKLYPNNKTLKNL